MKHVRSALLFVAALLLLTAPAQAFQGVDAHVKAADGILYLVDQSGSMYMKHKATGVEKTEMAKQVLARLNAATTDLGYQGAVCLVNPNAVVVAPGEWDYATYASEINAIGNGGGVYGKLTPLGNSLAGLSNVLGSLPASTAMVLVSDGHQNLGQGATQALQALYAAYPNTVMHFVSVADTAKGEEILKQLAALKSESLLVDARNLINTNRAVEDFAQKAFYTLGDCVSLRSIYFDTAKYDLKKDSLARLDRMVAVLKSRHDLKIFLEGFADIRGGDAYNVTLATNRANAVKDYLVAQGCDADRVVIKGFGRSKYYPSLQTNRRVDIMVVWQ